MLLCLKVLILLSLLTSAAAGPDSDQIESAGIPLRQAPAPLRDIWLRFHEENLCLGVKAVFVFHAEGIKIWYSIRNEENYRRLADLVEPLKKSYRIELYAAQSEAEKNAYSRDDDDLLLNLWNNSELRIYMSGISNLYSGGGELPLDKAAVDREIRHRMRLYANEMLEWADKMERLATDLPQLTEAGHGAENAIPERERVRRVCLDHVREIGNYSGKLADNLHYAIPKGKDELSAAGSEDVIPPVPVGIAELVAKRAQEIAWRITAFFYPRTRIVIPGNLPESGLIASLKSLQKLTLEFEKSVQKAK